MKKIFISLFFVSIWLFIFWVGGYDFNERGFEAVFCTTVSVFIFAATYLFQLVNWKI